MSLIKKRNPKYVDTEENLALTEFIFAQKKDCHQKNIRGKVTKDLHIDNGQEKATGAALWRVVLIIFTMKHVLALFPTLPSLFTQRVYRTWDRNDSSVFFMELLQIWRRVRRKICLFGDARKQGLPLV